MAKVQSQFPPLPPRQEDQGPIFLRRAAETEAAGQFGFSLEEAEASYREATRPIPLEEARRAYPEYQQAYAALNTIAKRDALERRPIEYTKPDGIEPAAFDTRLPAGMEDAFKEWKAEYAPKDSGQDYDLRGAFLAGVKPDKKSGHWPDTFKKPNHPTFSVESKYAQEVPELAGRWDGETFIPPDIDLEIKHDRQMILKLKRPPDGEIHGPPSRGTREVRNKFPMIADPDWHDFAPEEYSRLRRIWEIARDVTADQFDPVRTIKRTEELGPQDRADLLQAVGALAAETPREGLAGAVAVAGRRSMVRTVDNIARTLRLSDKLDERDRFYLNRLAQVYEAHHPLVQEDDSAFRELAVGVTDIAPPIALGAGVAALTGGAAAAAGAGAGIAGAAAAAAGGASWFTQIYPGEYDAMRDLGLNEEQATVAGVASAAVQASLPAMIGTLNPFFGKTPGIKQLSSEVRGLREIMETLRGKAITPEAAEAVQSFLRQQTGAIVKDAAADYVKTYVKTLGSLGLMNAASETAKAVATRLSEDAPDVPILETFKNTVDRTLATAGPLGILIAPTHIGDMGFRIGRARRIGELIRDRVGKASGAPPGVPPPSGVGPAPKTPAGPVSGPPAPPVAPPPAPPVVPPVVPPVPPVSPPKPAKADVAKLRTPEGAKEWVGTNPEQAKAIAAIEAPTRKDFQGFFPGTNWNKAQRTAFADSVRSILATETKAPEIETPPVKTETQEPKGETPPEVPLTKPPEPDAPVDTTGDVNKPKAAGRVVYQGRGKTLAQIYGQEAVDEGRAVPLFGKGEYYALTEKDAEGYGKVTEHPEPALKNPFVLDSDAKWFQLLRDSKAPHLNNMGREFYDEPGKIPEATERLQKFLRDAGHDGIVVKLDPLGRETRRLEAMAGHDQIVVFPELRKDGKTPEAPAAEVRGPVNVDEATFKALEELAKKLKTEAQAPPAELTPNAADARAMILDAVQEHWDDGATPDEIAKSTKLSVEEVNGALDELQGGNDISASPAAPFKRGAKPIVRQMVEKVLEGGGQPYADVLATIGPFVGKEAVPLVREAYLDAYDNAADEVRAGMDEPAAVEKFTPEQSEGLVSGAPVQGLPSAKTSQNPSNIHRVLPPNSAPDATPVQIGDMIKLMESITGAPHRIGRGRFLQRKASGWYHRFMHLIRQRNWRDIATHLHEFGHALHMKAMSYKLTHWPQKASAELLGLGHALYGSRKPNGGYQREGFAEYIARDILDDDMSVVAPEMYKWWNKTFLPAHPEIQSGLEKLRAMYKSWQDIGAEGRVGAQINMTGKRRGLMLRERLRRMKSIVLEAFHDSAYELERLDTKAGKLGFEDPEGGAYQMHRMFLMNATAYVDDALREGLSFISEANMGKRVGPSLMDLYGLIPDKDWDPFLRWMYARHALEMHAQNKGKPDAEKRDPGIDEADAQFVFDKYKDRAEFEQGAKMFTEMNDAIPRLLHDSGAISTEELARILDAFETYMPTLRVFDEGDAEKLPRSGGGMGKRLIPLGPALHRRKGSGRQLLNPIIAYTMRLMAAYNRAQKQEIINKIVAKADPSKYKRTAEGAAAGLQDVGSGIADLIEEIPTGKVKELFSASQIKEQVMGLVSDALSKTGDLIDEDALKAAVDWETLLYMWRPDYQPPGGKPIIRVFDARADKTRWFLLDPNLYSTVMGTNELVVPHVLEFLLSPFALVSRLTKAGWTGLNTFFSGRNLVRDFRRAVMQSDQKGAGRFWSPPVMGARYALALAAKFVAGRELPADIYWWRKMGGHMMSPLGNDAEGIAKRLRRMPAKSLRWRLVDAALHPLETIENILKLTESPSRIAEFSRILADNGWTPQMLRQGLKSGTNPSRKLLMKAFLGSADVTIDYRNKGSATRVLDRYIPFLGAFYSANRATARTIRKHPARTLLLSLVAMAAGLAYWLHSRKKKGYEEEEGWLKYGYWNIRDEDGRVIARIPREQQWDMLTTSAFEALLNHAVGEDPDAIDDYAKLVKQDYHWTRLVPPIATSLVESIENKDYFRDKPIYSGPKVIGNFEENAQTMQLSKDVAKLLGPDWSPARLQHFIDRGVTGGLYSGIGERVAQASDGQVPELQEAPFIGGFAVRSEHVKAPKKFDELLDKTEREYNSAGQKARTDPALTTKRDVLRTYGALIDDIKGMVPRSNDRDERFKVEKYVIGLSRRALGERPNELYPDPLTAPGIDMPPSVRVAVDQWIGKLAMRLEDGPGKTPASKFAREGLDAVAVEILRGIPSPTIRGAAVRSARGRGWHYGRANKAAGRIVTRLKKATSTQPSE